MNDPVYIWAGICDWCGAEKSVRDGLAKRGLAAVGEVKGVCRECVEKRRKERDDA